MGAAKRADLQVAFDRRLRLEFQGAKVTTDGGLLAVDPAMRAVVGRRASERQAASTNTLSRFATETLTHAENLAAWAALNGAWVSRARDKTKSPRIILDLDSSGSPVHGQQEGSSYNGHFGLVCYHPLFCFNQYGDCEGALLRPGHVHSAERWRELLEPVVARY